MKLMANTTIFDIHEILKLKEVKREILYPQNSWSSH